MRAFSHPLGGRRPRRKSLLVPARLVVSSAVCALAVLACQVSPASSASPSSQKTVARNDDGTIVLRPPTLASGRAGSLSKAIVPSVAAGPRGLAAYALVSGGALTPIAGSPFATPSSEPEGVAISPNGRYLYVSYEDGIERPGGIAAFAIGSGGELTAVPGSPYATVPQPGSLAISPDGRHLYVVNQGGPGDPGGLRAFAIGSRGELAALSGSFCAEGTEGAPWGLAISPNGKYLYVTDTDSGDGAGGLSAYAVGPDGALSALPGSPYTTGPAGSPWGLAISPNGKYLYVTNSGSEDGSGGLSGYSIGPDGRPSALSNSLSSTSAAGSPWGIAISPDGRHLYVADSGSEDGSDGLSAYAIGANGALSELPGSPYSTGSAGSPWALAISPSGRYLYVTNDGSENGFGGLSAYAIGPGGALTGLFDSPIPTGPAGSPWSVAVSPNGDFLYVTNQGSTDGSGGLSAYAIDSESALAAPAATGSAPQGVAISPDRGYFFVTNHSSADGGGGLSAYAVDSSGEIVSLPGSPYPTSPAGHPAGVAVSPDGGHLYVTNYGSVDGEGGISVFSVGPDGTLSALPDSPPESGSRGQPYAVAISPNGRYLYVTNHGSTDGEGGLSAFAIGSGGTLAALPGSPYATSRAGYPAGLAISPDGRFLYVTSTGSPDSEGGLSAFAVGSGGTLTALPGSPYATTAGGYPYGVAVSADGKRLYVIDRGTAGTAGISTYAIGSNGVPSPKRIEGRDLWRKNPS